MRKYWMGIDLGGTTAKLALFRTAGQEQASETVNGQSQDVSGSPVISRPELVCRTAIPTRTGEGGRFVIPDIAEAAGKLAASAGIDLSDVAGAGLGVPGPVLEETDRGFPVDGCVNLNLEGIHYMDRELMDLTGIPRIVVLNDANAAALGELYFGSADGEAVPDRTAPDKFAAGIAVPAGPAHTGVSVLPSSAVVVTLGTGIGGGIISGGGVITGAFGAAGEIGHMPVSPGHALIRILHEADPDYRLTADLEYYASATGIARMARTALKRTDADWIWRLPEMASGDASAADGMRLGTGTDGNIRSVLRELPDPMQLEARHVFDAAKNGDPIGLAVISAFFDILGQGLAAIASVVDPDLFIIGGGVSAAGAFLLDGLQESYRRQVFHASRGAAFRLASLGNDAGLLGPLVPLLR